METKELNETLARWRWPEAKAISVIANPNGVWLVHVWVEAGHVEVFSPFTKSLDAIFKYIIPTFYEQYDSKQIHSMRTFGILHNWIIDLTRKDRDNRDPEAAALRLCNALEPLIKIGRIDK